MIQKETKLKWLREAADTTDEHRLWPLEWGSPSVGVRLGYGWRGVMTPLAIACHMAHGEPKGEARFAGCTCEMMMEGCIAGGCVRWMTGKERNATMRARGTHARGATMATAKLDDDKVREILLSTDRYIVIARRYGVSSRTIKGIRAGLAWKHVERPDGYDDQAQCVVGGLTREEW